MKTNVEDSKTLSFKISLGRQNPRHAEATSKVTPVHFP